MHCYELLFRTVCCHSTSVRGKDSFHSDLNCARFQAIQIQTTRERSQCDETRDAVIERRLTHWCWAELCCLAPVSMREVLLTLQRLHFSNSILSPRGVYRSDFDLTVRASEHTHSPFQHRHHAAQRPPLRAAHICIQCRSSRLVSSQQCRFSSRHGKCRSGSKSTHNGNSVSIRTLLVDSSSCVEQCSSCRSTATITARASRTHAIAQQHCE